MALWKGIDVSEANGTLNWAKLKSAGVKFAIIRSGYGKGYLDPQFAANVKGCEANGIPYGVYHFSYALDTAGVKKEADWCKSLINKYCKVKPFCVAFDFEGDTVRYASDCGVTLGKTAFNNHTKVWNDYFGGLGYSTPVYLNYSYYNNWYDKSVLKGYPLWIAYYQPNCFISNYTIWQQSSSGTLAGHSCRFDINYADSDYVGTGKAVTPTPAPSKPAYKYAGYQWWQNGSTPEPVYDTSDFSNVIGSLDPREQALCFGRYSEAYAVTYYVGDSTVAKIGWVKYHGGTDF